jgi:ribose transport system substrate-binding protein
VRKPVVVLATVALVAALAGCGEDEAASGSGTAQQRDVKVALVVHFQSPFTEEMQKGARAAAKELGADLTIAGPSGFDPPQAIAQFNDTIAAGAEGVAMVPYPTDVWQRPLEEAARQDTKLATLNVPIVEAAEHAPLYVGVNEIDMGRSIARLVLDALGEDRSGDLVVGNCLPGVQVLVDRVDGIKEVMKEEAPEMRVLGDFDTTGDPTSNYAAWESLMIKHKDAAAFAGVCAPDLPSMVKAKERLDVDAVIVGNDFDPEAVRGIDEGIAQGSVGQSPYLQGYVPVRALIEALQRGEDVPAGWIDAGIEVVKPEDVDELTKRAKDDAAYEAHYNARARAVFEDFDAALRPLSDLRR